MNIYTRAGAMVQFNHPEGDFKYGIEMAKKHLIVGQIYKIAKIDIYDWTTDVWLEGVKGSYSSSMFDNVENYVNSEDE